MELSIVEYLRTLPLTELEVDRHAVNYYGPVSPYWSLVFVPLVSGQQLKIDAYFQSILWLIRGFTV